MVWSASARGFRGIFLALFVIPPLVPAKAGTQRPPQWRVWIPACAGTSGIGTRRAGQALALAAGLLVVASLAGCGRKGPLDPPPSAALPPAPAATAPATAAAAPGSTAAASPQPGTPHDRVVRSGFDAAGNPVAAAGEKKPFILDFLLQ